MLIKLVVTRLCGRKRGKSGADFRLLLQALRGVSLLLRETEVTYTAWRQDSKEGFAESRRQEEIADEVGEA
jgi:hypothetical protein